MLQRLIDDVKQSTGSALRLTSLAAAAAIAMHAWVLQHAEIPEGPLR